MRCKACTRHEARERGCDAHHTSPMNLFVASGVYRTRVHTAWHGRRLKLENSAGTDAVGSVTSSFLWLFGCLVVLENIRNMVHVYT